MVAPRFSYTSWRSLVRCIDLHRCIPIALITGAQVAHSTSDKSHTPRHCMESSSLSVICIALLYYKEHIAVRVDSPRIYMACWRCDPFSYPVYGPLSFLPLHREPWCRKSGSQRARPEEDTIGHRRFFNIRIRMSTSLWSTVSWR